MIFVEEFVGDLRTAPMRLTNVGENAERLMLTAATEIETLWRHLKVAEPAMMNCPARDRVREFIASKSRS